MAPLEGIADDLAESVHVAEVPGAVIRGSQASEEIADRTRPSRMAVAAALVIAYERRDILIGPKQKVPCFGSN